jgi:hypothetical protein
MQKGYWPVNIGMKDMEEGTTQATAIINTATRTKVNQLKYYQLFHLKVHLSCIIGQGVSLDHKNKYRVSL